MRAQQALHLLRLDLNATRADHIILPSEDTEAPPLFRLYQFDDIIGYETFRAHLRSIDNQTVVCRHTDTHRWERRIPV